MINDLLNPQATTSGALNNLAIFATLVLAAVTGLTWLRNALVALVKANRLAGLKLSGIYAGERDNKATGGWLFEIIDIRVVLDRIRGQSLYVHRSGEEYHFSATRARVHPNVLLGTWRSVRDSENYGEVLWNADRNGKTALNGCWAGTTRGGKVNFGAWRLMQCSRADSSRVRATLNPSRFRRSWQSFSQFKSRTRSSPAAIRDILERHKQDDARTFVHAGYTYNVAHGVFNPRLGKVSIALLDAVLGQRWHSDVRSVLDWGTGCGFYSIAIATTHEFATSGGHVWALESNSQAAACARSNVARFALNSHIDVIEGDSPKIILENARPRKFDLIVANLPFTIAPRGDMYAKESMFGSFCTTHRAILEMAVAFRSHLSESGRAVLAYGDSGDVKWLDTCLRIVGLVRTDVVTIDKSRGATDDDMYIFEIRRVAPASAIEDTEHEASLGGTAYARSA